MHSRKCIWFHFFQIRGWSCGKEKMQRDPPERCDASDLGTRNFDAPMAAETETAFQEPKTDGDGSTGGFWGVISRERESLWRNEGR
jgi:hypothetical protein